MARFKKGDYKVQCDLTGAIVNASECRLMWNGLFVQKRFWQPRHPQDHATTIKEMTRPSLARPFGDPVFLPVPAATGMEFSDGTGVTWGDGTEIEWSSGSEE